MTRKQGSNYCLLESVDFLKWTGMVLIGGKEVKEHHGEKENWKSEIKSRGGKRARG